MCVWQFVSDSEGIHISDPRHKDLISIAEILKRGKYRLIGGLRVPSIGSVTVTIASFWMTLSAVLVIVLYLLLGFIGSSVFWPDWLKNMDPLLFLTCVWLLASGFLAAYHMSEPQRIPEHNLHIGSLSRMLVGALFLPVVFGAASVSWMASIFSPRDYGTHWLYDRIHAHLGMKRRFKFANLYRSLKREFVRKKWID